MDKKKECSTVSLGTLLTEIAELEGGENALRELLLQQRRTFSDRSIVAGGDVECLQQIEIIDQLLVVLRGSIDAESSLGNGTVGEETRRDARGRH